MQRRYLLLALLLAVSLGVTPAAMAQPDDETRIAESRSIPRDDLALSTAFRGTGPLPRVARTTPLDLEVGDVETFWIGDPATGANRQVRAELRYAGPQLLMYVDTTIEVEQVLVERSARVFEQRIYPRNRSL